MSEFASLLATLPDQISSHIPIELTPDLVEIVIDVGRPIEMRFLDRELVVLDIQVSNLLLQDCVNKLPKFGANNRSGIDGALHRVSRILDRFGEPVGLTYRIGRYVPNCSELLNDLIAKGKSVLLLGPPGVGKTTKLRDIAKRRSTEDGCRVVVVDTSNEIAGDGRIPHEAIGRARRLSVPPGKNQYALMREAVENHMPEVIIVDEISDLEETNAARTISQRGIQLIATAHGQTLTNLMLNPDLSGLIGGTQAVTRGDRWANKNSGRKSVIERQYPPVFDVVVELVAYDEAIVHDNLASVVDALLKGGAVRGERRKQVVDGKFEVIEDAKIEEPKPEPSVPAPVTVAERVVYKDRERTPKAPKVQYKRKPYNKR